MNAGPINYDALDAATRLDPVAYKAIQDQAHRVQRRARTRTSLAIAAVSVLAIGMSGLAISAFTSTDDSGTPPTSKPSTQSPETSDREWQASIFDYRTRLVDAAGRERAFSGARLDNDARELILYGTGHLPESLRALVADHPTQVGVRWVTVEHSAAEYADAAERIKQQIPEVHGTEWNGWGPIVLIVDPSGRSREEQVLARAREITTIPLSIRFEPPASAL